MKLTHCLKLILGCFLIITNIQAQVGIGTTDPKSLLDISVADSANPTATDGILIPRVNNLNATPGRDQHGMMVFLNTGVAKGFYYWDWPSTSWIMVGTAEWQPSTNSSGDNLIHAIRTNSAGHKVVVTEDGRVGIGTDDPEESLEVKYPGDNDIQISSVSPSNAPNFIFYTTNGTDFANRDFLSDDEPIGYITAKAYNGTGKSGDLANIQIKTDGVHTAASLPTKIEFVVTQENSTGIDAANPQMVIKNNGNVGIGINDPAVPLHVNGIGYVSSHFGVGGTTLLGYDTAVNPTGGGLLVSGNTTITSLNSGGTVYSNTSGTLTIGPTIIAAGKVDATATPAGSNLTGATVTHNSTGDYTVTLSAAASSANYVIQLSTLNCNNCSARDDSINIYYENQTINGFDVIIGSNDTGINGSKDLADREFMFTVINF
ncbi:MAG: hypothetical protein CL526_09580 [Aequorivita sp.]|nr:hypothetical protein [Aequorivita sp.]|tara:strand:+ start:32787 stop:34079 length:1293 start_codon:yes stop_codon:yes gene_type:complete